MTHDREFEARGIDLGRPNPARIYDWYLGGTANWAIDRELGAKTLRAFPLTKDLATANRGFLRTVVRYCVEHGVDQFLDLGSGVPTVGNVHEVAEALNPASRCVYVDNEPVAVAHSQLLLEQHGEPERHVVINADLRDTDYVWDRAIGTGVLNPERPIALLMMSVLHFVHSDDEVHRALARYRSLLPSGSYVAASHITEDALPDDLAERVAAGIALYQQSSTPIRSRTRTEFAAFFDGLDLVEPGIVSASSWGSQASPQQRDAAAGDRDNPAYQVYLAGCARTP